MSTVDERNLEHTRAIAEERAPVLDILQDEPPRARVEIYEAVVLDFLSTIRRYNLCLETTENAEAFAAKVREYLRTGPDAVLR